MDNSIAIASLYNFEKESLYTFSGKILEPRLKEGLTLKLANMSIYYRRIIYLVIIEY